MLSPCQPLRTSLKDRKLGKLYHKVQGATTRQTGAGEEALRAEEGIVRAGLRPDQTGEGVPAATYRGINPVALLQQINRTMDHLWRLDLPAPVLQQVRKAQLGIR